MDDKSVRVASGSHYAMLFDATRGHRLVLSVALLLSVGASLLSIYQPKVLETVVNDLLGSKSVVQPTLLLVVLAVSTTVAQGLQAYVVQRGAESVAQGLRSRTVDRFLSRTVSAHDQANSADLLARATADINVIKMMIAAGAVPILGAVVMVVGVSVFMMLIDPLLYLLTILAVLLGLLIVILVGKSARAKSFDLQTDLGVFASTVERLLSGIRTVKSAGAEDVELKNSRRTSQEVWASGVKLARLVSVMQPLVNFCIQGALLLVVALGALRLGSGNLNFGELLSFLVYLFMLIVPIASLGQAYSQLQVGFGALSRITMIDYMEAEDDWLDDDVVLRHDSEFIEFQDVSFGYVEGETVLENCSFSIKKGDKVAIVGHSGAGKSTIVELIERFYAPDEGRISIEGRSIHSLYARDHRKRIALVSQDVEALTGTVRENLQPGPSAQDDETLFYVLEAVGMCGPNGRSDLDLDTDLGQGGISLSGGQRQRLAWARLLLSDAEILLLDEATSHLDPHTEAAMFDLLQAHSVDRTVLMVTHREAASRFSDRLLLMADGSIIGEGTHEELLQNSNEYRRLRAESEKEAPHSPDPLDAAKGARNVRDVEVFRGSQTLPVGSRS